MTLDDLCKKVIFQNSVDVWISLCGEKNADWDDMEGYKRFIKRLQDGGTALKKYSLCVSDAQSADAFERKKAAFAESLSESGDPCASAYTIRLSGSTIAKLREMCP